jgi:hypothetical protein
LEVYVVNLSSTYAGRARQLAPAEQERDKITFSAQLLISGAEREAPAQSAESSGTVSKN